FFINESIIVKDTKGIKFEFREEGGEDMNDVIHIVRVPRDPEYDYLISIDGNKFGTPYDSTIMKGFSDKNLVKEGWEEVIATNGSIFYYYDKSCYAEGLEKSRGVNNQPFDMHAVSKFKDTMALGCKWNGDLDIDYQRNIQANINNYYGAITGAFGLLKNGYKNTAGAELENIRNGLYSGLSGRTVWGYDSKTDTYMVISHPGVTGKSGIRGDALVELCKKEGMTDAICLDGGGSRWLRFEGKELATTTRKVKNAVILYRRKKKGTILDEPINKPVEETKPQDASPKEEIKELLAKLIELVEKL
ncbi:MAG: phosphodiester glycosidase family protein, partial [Treponema sp.]|nr:phosphodiester glycosidase family protein [Treponema sp.]